MSKVIAAINMTLDGFCDHDAIIPDEAIHQHYTELLSEGAAILYGRKTYQLMEFWQPFVKNPSGEKNMDDFAMAIDKIPKILFSSTLKNADAISNDWKSARLANRTLEEEVLALKQSLNKDENIFIGSRSLIIQLMILDLIDEYQFCIHPVLIGNGLPLFENVKERKLLNFIKSKTFSSGAIILYYEPSKTNIQNN